MISTCEFCHQPIYESGSLWRHVGSQSLTCPGLGGQPHQPPESEIKAIQFAAADCSVMRGQEHICLAKSGTMAQRIARALNSYKPGRKGK